MLAVAYPAALSVRARLGISGASRSVQSGTASLAKGRLWPAIQSVMRSRAGYWPVMRQARDGEQTVQAE